ncbi:AAA family ATPase [Clostridium botulinum]|uniref:AAA family ATPase n=1 Tax=Clostridium botulinum TaxID=1491 RepID=UPI0001F851C7|nr:AAA family ATPase [Clostridium botulinum]NFB16472.1 AAA family ATPase [Clostridium botulinum]NFB69130.1 AAA family ATPase [Clostridium botulinum]NFB96558.1 AAA family ATPase [Clostridium botulinum]NFC46332.1 AAA family ATPase [Clostridium botulinum]NFC57257.1 AAA family ATPase [Clostridium botulinum]
MKKRFNVTGTCIPEKHYMVDISKKLDSILKLIDNEEYFIINRPRQYGKTTTLYMLEKRLNKMEEYLPIKISFEAIDTEGYSEAKKFLSSIMMQIINYFRFSTKKEIYKFVKRHENKVNTMNEFNRFITDLIEFTEKKVVLIIDEVDKSSNNQLFLDFLGMLRSKYLLRNEGKDYTFHSVILAGVHDVKTLKLKIRSDEEYKYNSPWNIASDFDVDMSFSRSEIKTMLDDYVENKQVALDKEYFAEKLYFYTSGYPFLVSKLCKIIDEKIMDENKLEWKKEYLEIAVKELLKDSNTNFDSLIKNIENNEGLSQLVDNLLIKGVRINFNIHNPDINLGCLYGIFKDDKGNLKINNRIYEQLIYDYRISKIQTSSNFYNYNSKENFIDTNGDLNIRKVLLKFQEFMQHEYSKKRKGFLEEDGRLVFLAFLSPIINGSGFAFKEVKAGEEKRFDIVITYNKKMYILELKIWRGEEYHKKGLIQLAEYLEQYKLDKGYLLIFDLRKSTNLIGEVEENYIGIENNSKKIIQIYC